MSARKSSQSTNKTKPTPEITDADNHTDILMLILDEFIDAHALVTVAYRHIEEWDDADRGAAVRVLGQGVEALDELAAKLERIRKYQEKRGEQGAVL